MYRTDLFENAGLEMPNEPSWAFIKDAARKLTDRSNEVYGICLESSAKLPKFLTPTIRENLARGGSIKYATLVIAAWCFYSDKGRSRHGVELEIVDEMKDELHQAALRTADDPLSFLRLETIFGDLASNVEFTALYSEMIQAIYEDSDIALHMRKILSA